MGAPSTYKAITAVTGTATACATSAKLRALVLQAGSAAATVTVYDNASAGSGNQVTAFTIPSGQTWSHDFSDGVDCLNGITATVSGTGATAFVYFNRE